MQDISSVGVRGKRVKRYGTGRLASQLENLESRMLMTAAPVTVSPVAVTEGNGVTYATLTARVNTAIHPRITLGYYTVDGTAKSGLNYAATRSALVIPANSNSATFTIPILANNLQQGTTSFSVKTVYTYGQYVGQQSTQVSIADNDVPPVVTVASAGVEAGGAAQFNVNLSHATTAPVTLRYYTKSMTAGADFTPVNSMLTIPAGQTTGTIAVQTRDWGNAQNDSFALVLAGATNATLAKPVVWGTIVPAKPTVSVADTSVLEGDSGTSTMTFTVTLSKASSQTVTVDYATADGGGVSAAPGMVGTPSNAAHAPSDYVAKTGTLTFSPGQTSKTVTVAVNGDVNIEVDEKLRLILSNASNATLGSAIGLGTILNDDVTAITMGSASAGVVDGSGNQTMRFTVTLTHSSTSQVTVDYATADGTAVAGTDYTATSGTLIFAPGETSKTVDVTVSGNSVSPVETLHLNLSDASGAPLATATALGTIYAAQDWSNTLGGTTNGSDGADFLAANFTTGPSDQGFVSVTLDFLFDPPTLKIYSDDGGHPGTEVGTLTYAGGSTNFGITRGTYTSDGLTLSANTTYWVVNEEGGWVMTVSNGTGEGYLGGAMKSTDGVTWSDDSTGGTYKFKMQVKTAYSGPQISIDSPSVAEAVGNNTPQTMHYTVTLSRAATFPVTVDYATADGTAADGVDYTGTTGTLTFAPGETSKTIDVTVNGNTAEADETFDVNLSNASNGTVATATGTGTIQSVVPVTLSDNLSEAAFGAGNLYQGTPDAQAFSTGASAVTLSSVTMTLQMEPDFMGGLNESDYVLRVEIFSDNGGVPGTSLGTLTNPASFPSSTQNTTFGGNGIALSANTQYWVVATADVGYFGWDVTWSTNGNGVGFNTAGDMWNGSGWSNFHTFKMQVIAI